jgi:hypothetical protein
MKIIALRVALAALAALAAPSLAVAAGGTHVTTGSIVVFQSPSVVRPSAVAVLPVLPQTPVVIARPFFPSMPVVVTRPVFAQGLIIVGRPFVITQPVIVQQQVMVRGSGFFFTTPGTAVISR